MLWRTVAATVVFCRLSDCDSDSGAFCRTVAAAVVFCRTVAATVGRSVGLWQRQWGVLSDCGSGSGVLSDCGSDSGAFCRTVAAVVVFCRTVAATVGRSVGLWQRQWGVLSDCGSGSGVLWDCGSDSGAFCGTVAATVGRFVGLSVIAVQRVPDALNIPTRETAAGCPCSVHGQWSGQPCRGKVMAMSVGMVLSTSAMSGFPVIAAALPSECELKSTALWSRIPGSYG